MKRAKRDVLRALREARPAELDPANLAGTPRQERDLDRIMASGTGLDAAPASVSRARAWRWALPVTAAAAVAALAGSLVTVTSGGGDHVPPAAVGQADAKLTLLDAADKLAEPGPRKAYWRWSTESRNVYVVGAGAETFSVVDTEQREHSVGVEPGTKSLWVTNLNASVRPRTPEDAAAWKRAGSPTEVKVLSEGSSPLITQPMTPRKPHATQTNRRSAIYALGDENVSYADLLALPDEPDALRTVLLDRFSPVVEDRYSDETERLFTQAAALVTMPVERGVREAAYRVLADLPGIRSLGQVRDPMGRPGVGIAMPVSTSDMYGLVERQLIVDESTGLLLAEQEVLSRATPQQQAAGLADGTVVRSTSTLGVEWTDEELTAPAGATR